MRPSAQTAAVALRTFLCHHAIGLRNSIMSLVKFEADKASLAADLPILSISPGVSEPDR